MKLSELIMINVELWMEWNKTHSEATNHDLDYPIRARACKIAENIIEQINKNIDKIDEDVF